MLAKALKKIRQQLSLFIMVVIVLLAAYVSIGRQFMPAVAGYIQFFERQITAVTGVPVRIEALTGSFQGFNPALTISGLRLRVADGGVVGPDLEAIYFESAQIAVDVPRSIWRRQWVLEDFSVKNLEVNLEQNEEGGWQLQGISRAGGGARVELAKVYESFLSISRLDIENVSLNVQTNSGDRYRFNNGSASIRNQDATHYLYLSAFPENNRAAISASLEVEGQRLAQMTGRLHLDIPVDNYTEITANQGANELTILELVGGAEVWASLESGKIKEIVAQPQISRLAFKGPYSAGTVLQQINGVVKAQLNASLTHVDMSNMYLSWAGINWLDFNASIAMESGSSLGFYADQLNIDLLAGVVAKSGLINPDAQMQLEQFAPRGLLENFNLSGVISEGSLQSLGIVSNIARAAVSSVNGSPNISGIDGYVELDYNGEAKLLKGFGEVESQDFSIGIPNVFTSTWEYSYANGSLDFLVDLSDGQEIRLVSSVVVAESEAVDANVKFASYLRRYPDGRRESELDLFVGASRMNAARKALYLPDGPSVDDALRRSMNWVDEAVLGGDITSAGVLYRGSTVPGAPPTSKTFQSFFELSRANMVFSDEWPALSELSAFVYTDDNEIDLAVDNGESMGLVLENAAGTIRRSASGENWLKIAGLATGATSAGLDYLQNAAVGEQIKNAFYGWEASGDLDAKVSVDIPLSEISQGTEVRIELALTDNNLVIPEYALALEQVAGDVIFDTRTGVETTGLTGTLFSQPVEIALSSSINDGELETIVVDAQGSATPQQLIEWPLQSDFVVNILGYAEGEIGFTSQLRLELGAANDRPTALRINSNLQGAKLSLPEPYAKQLAQEMPLALNIEFGPRQKVAGSFADNLGFRFGLNEGAISDGIVYLSETQSNLENLAASPTQGVAIVGDLAYLKLEQWTNFLDGFGGGQTSRNELDAMIAFVDLQLDEFELYGQLLPDVAVRIDLHPVLSAWSVKLASDSIRGQVDIPFSDADYLLLDLEYLRLPGDEDDLAALDGSAIEEIKAMAEEPIDPLVDIDPRTLPKMIFSTNDFSIGDKPYGSWQFQLDPIAAGADLTDLAFDFRGLRLELPQDGPDSEADGSGLIPHFVWTYDGLNHRSELAGLIQASNMADVLRANGLAAVFESSQASFATDIEWPGSPAFFAASALSGTISMNIENGRFLQNAGGNGALKLISIINFDAIMRRLRFSDDLLRRGLAYDEITADFTLNNGQVTIEDRLVISGPSSLYQITGDLDLAQETINGELYVTLPVSRNIPWIGVLTANIPLAVGAYLFDRIFGDQVNSLTSAVYSLDGSWEGLEPEFKQAFGSPEAPLPN
jgi:uncharacterized protein (TIGR02099 family)